MARVLHGTGGVGHGRAEDAAVAVVLGGLVEVALGGDLDGAVGASGAVVATTTSLDTMRLGAASVSDLEVGTVDLSACESAIGTRVDGVIGYNFLSRFRVGIDYQEKSLTLEEV